MSTTWDLQPGDCLLYAPTGIFGYLISVKTWHKVSHCEVYVGKGMSAASRSKGVNLYDTRYNDLIHVLRPTGSFNIDDAMMWFWNTAIGQRYDYWGLLRFAWRSDVVPDAKDNRMFCSEFLTRFYRKGGLTIFGNEDADAIAPFQFLTTSDLLEVQPICG